MCRPQWIDDADIENRHAPLQTQPSKWVFAAHEGPETGSFLIEEETLEYSKLVIILNGTPTAPCLLVFTIYQLRNQDRSAQSPQSNRHLSLDRKLLRPDQTHQLRYKNAILKESFPLSAAAPGFNTESIALPRGAKFEPVTIVTLANDNYPTPPALPIMGDPRSREFATHRLLPTGIIPSRAHAAREARDVTQGNEAVGLGWEEGLYIGKHPALGS
ncbi:hypothetical protein GJ744_007992 [Endocarpon pusillum]|uniref:Uncharacterized protein n=1 Tax=Endocarpon pusillum TaxID=364733 RepID=A0A8H7AJS1_9EURO|nr:hypothetical protein GJ744_007992 [Endocarpon pusillum]